MGRSYLLALALLAGCSAIVDDSTVQCKVNADCDALGAGLVCSDRFCISPSAAQAECSANTDCVSKRGAGYVCNAAKACEAPTGCSKHSECTTKLGQVAICRTDGQCAPLFTPLCDEVLPAGAEKNDDMFLVGFMGLVKGPSASYGQAQKGGEAVALDELQNNLGRLPGATGNDARRNLAMLVCDHGTDNGSTAANHLVNDLKVPAILGASYSGVTLNAFGIAQPRDVLVFSPAATSPALTNEADPKDLLWRTVPSDKLQSEALKLIVPVVTQALIAKGVLPPGGLPKVAIPWKNDAAGGGLLQGVNDEPNAISYGSYLKYEVDPIEKADPTYVAARVKEIVDLQPNIIMHLGTGEFIELVMPLIEAQWTGKDRPWYIVPEGDLEQLKGAVLGKLINSNGIASRLIGTSPGARRSEAWRTFQTKYQGEPGNLAEFAYDAVYLLAYAIAGSNKQFPTGIELAAGLRKTSCKNPGSTRVRAGTADFGIGWMSATSPTGCLDYTGAGGDLDFGPAGEADADIALGCLQSAVPANTYKFTRIDTYYPISQRKLAPYKGAPLDLTNPNWCTPAAP